MPLLIVLLSEVFRGNQSVRERLVGHVILNLQDRGNLLFRIIEAKLKIHLSLTLSNQYALIVMWSSTTACLR